MSDLAATTGRKTTEGPSAAVYEAADRQAAYAHRRRLWAEEIGRPTCDLARRPLAIDLYCGLGGWTEGLLAEGWDVIGFDIEEHIYGEDRYPAKLVIQDVLTLHGSQFKDADLIVGSSPCQEFSYRAMPWKRAKALGPPELGMKLFAAQFRIQREASEAAGRHIPMVVENVRGAQPWVGRAAWNYGSYYLWGDVPALMPWITKATKVAGFRFDGSGRSFQTAAVDEHLKAGGGSWFNDYKSRADKPSVLLSHTSSKSSARKMASAKIAKIPLTLSRHIAQVYWPTA